MYVLFDSRQINRNRNRNRNTHVTDLSLIYVTDKLEITLVGGGWVHWNRTTYRVYVEVNEIFTFIGHVFNDFDSMLPSSLHFGTHFLNIFMPLYGVYIGRARYIGPRK